MPTVVLCAPAHRRMTGERSRLARDRTSGGGWPARGGGGIVRGGSWPRDRLWRPPLAVTDFVIVEDPHVPPGQILHAVAQLRCFARGTGFEQADPQRRSGPG